MIITGIFAANKLARECVCKKYKGCIESNLRENKHSSELLYCHTFC